MDLQAVEKEIQAIPGNEPVLEALYELLDAGEAIALVGAGASAGVWPLWNQFLDGFIEHAQRNGRINEAEAAFFKEEAPQTPLETAQQLRNKIGEPLYFEYLQTTFSDKTCPKTGGAFTQTHHALLRLPIHNYLTLNYDAGLTNARAALYPRATTSYFFWDQEEARRIRDKGFKRLVLHAHGRHDRADSIILTLDDYRKAYSNRPYVRLLNDLFAFEKLLIVGFGLTDPYIKQLFNNISRDYEKGALRHIAFVGLDDEEVQVTALRRERVEMIYGARILFYPTRDHHKALTDWLTAFAEKYSGGGGGTAEEIQPATVSPDLKRALPDKYIHRPTDDKNFRGRETDLATLNRWGVDPGVRIIALTGIGGQGKTALVGRWLKEKRSPELAGVPVFYWSFYEDLDVRKFLEALVAFVSPIVRVAGEGEIEPISFLLDVVREVRLLLVLDGLEVLQEDADSPAHGRINNSLLEGLLQQWVRYPHQSLMILTSRFNFPQLARYSGVGFHQISLLHLSRADGVSLLRVLEIRGDEALLGEYVEQLHGHPLGLRVLASAVKRSCYGDLAQFEGEGVLTADADDTLSGKLERLLAFYESQLEGGQKELLGIISLFKRPVEMRNFVTLLAKMESLKGTPLAGADEASIQRGLDTLIDDFLVEKTGDGITTHPVIRDYFRGRHQLIGSRREVADFLKARPGSERPQNIEAVRDLVEAVALLCDEGEFKAGDDLFKSRLVGGTYRFSVFRDLPAPAEGLECNLTFVSDEARRRKVEEVLGKSRLAFYMSGASLYNGYLGNLTQAREWRYKDLDISRQLSEKRNQAVALHEISVIEMRMGDISAALETVSQGLHLLHETRNLSDLRNEFAYKAYYEFLLGDTTRVYQDFEIALCYEQKRKADQQFLYSVEGNYQAEFFIRLRAWKPFEAVNAWNIEQCKKYGWNDKLALCHLLQGWSEICRGRLTRVEEALTQAERSLRSSGMVEETCRLDWAWALLAEARGDYGDGLRRVEESLLTCADKGFRLRHADGLILRGRLRLMQFGQEGSEDADVLEKAGDDGDMALRIAEDTGYIWAKIEALELLASYHGARAERPGVDPEVEEDFARRHAEDAQSLKTALTLTERQMESLKAEARRESEEQVAGWDSD